MTRYLFFFLFIYSLLSNHKEEIRINFFHDFLSNLNNNNNNNNRILFVICKGKT